MLQAGDSLKIHITITDDDGNTFDGTAELQKTTTKKKIRFEHKPSKKIKGPAERLHGLFEASFFKDEKKQNEVTRELKSKGYNFSRQSIFMALNGAEFLVKKGAKRNYSYIQKYPPS